MANTLQTYVEALSAAPTELADIAADRAGIVARTSAYTRQVLELQMPRAALSPVYAPAAAVLGAAQVAAERAQAVQRHLVDETDPVAVAQAAVLDAFNHQPQKAA